MGIGFRALADLCRRTGTSYAAGVDMRTIWQREALRGSGRHQRCMRTISSAVSKGSSLTDAIDQTDGHLPLLFRDMVDVGERTGKMDTALLRLSRHYESMISRRRAFLMGISWPLLEFVVAIVVVGLAIALLGFVSKENLEFLGIHFWVGTQGFIAYVCIVAAGVAPIVFLTHGALSGRLPVALMSVLMKVPKLGRMLRLMAMSRMSWTLAMGVEAGMPIKQCVDIALRSTQNSFFKKHREVILQRLTQGDEMHVAFAHAGAFPQEFLDAVQVGEETGRLAESMETLTERYDEEGKLAMTAVTIAGGVLISMLVAAVIIFFIFAIANGYKNMLENAMDL